MVAGGRLERETRVLSQSVVSRRRSVNSWRPVVPNRFANDESDRRFRHADLADLAKPDAWAELMLVERRLAELRWSGSAARILDPVTLATDEDWLRERAGRLQAVLGRRADLGTRRSRAA